MKRSSSQYFCRKSCKAPKPPTHSKVPGVFYRRNLALNYPQMVCQFAQNKLNEEKCTIALRDLGALIEHTFTYYHIDEITYMDLMNCIERIARRERLKNARATQWDV